MTDKRLVPEGYIVLADNIDLRSGSLRPFKFPEPYIGIQGGIPSGTTCIYEFKNNWFFSSLYRDYTSEYVSAQTRVYFCETTISPNGMNIQNHLPPQKVVDGYQANLGSIVPSLAPTVTGTISNTPSKFTAAVANIGGNLGTGAYSYRISSIINNQIMPPSQSVIANIPQVGGVNITTGEITLSWATVATATGYVIFGRILGQEQTLFTLGSGATNVIDNGTNSPSGAYAANYQPTNPLTYVYTYVRDVGTMLDESGPSPVSNTSNSSFVRTITRNPTIDGLYQSASVYSAATQSTTSEYGSILITESINSGTNTILTLNAAPPISWPWWVNGLTLVFSSDPSLTGYTFSIPSALSRITVAPSLTTIPSGSIPSGSYQYVVCAVRGNPGIVIGVLPAATGSSPIASISFGVPSNVAISWNGVNGASGYLIYRYDGSSYEVVGLVSGNNTFFTDTNVIVQTATGFPTVNNTGIIYNPITVGQPISWENPSPISIGRIIVVTEAVPSTLLSASPFTIYLGATPINSFSPTFLGVDQDVIDITSATSNTLLGLFIYYHDSLGILAYPNFINVYTPANYIINSLDDFPNNGYYKYWNIYRAGDTGSQFTFVTQVPISQASYIDDISVTGLGGPLPTAYSDAITGGYVAFEPPPSDLLSPETYNGMLFGIDGNLVRWTPTDYPDAWPVIYNQSFAYPPQRLIAYSGGIYVFCENGVWRGDGFLPGQMSFQKTRADGCIAPYTPRIMGSHLLYVARRGIMALSGMDSSCVTERFIPYRLITEPSAFIGSNSGPNGLGNSIDGGYSNSIFIANIDGGYSNSTFSDSINGGSSSMDSTFWWLTTDHTSSYGALLDIGMNPIPAADTFGWVTAKDKPLSGLIWEARSFVWQNKYYLYYVNSPTNDYQGNPCWCLDFGIMNLPYVLPNYPISTLGFKPTDMHVSSTGECFTLLSIDASLDQINQTQFSASQSQFVSSFSPSGNNNTQAIYRFNPTFGANVPIRFRTSEIVAGAPQSRKRWREVRLNGQGSCQARIFIDGALLIMANGLSVTDLVLSESPVHPSRILLPPGSWGYSCSIEVCGDVTVRLIEMGFDPMTGED